MFLRLADERCNDTGHHYHNSLVFSALWTLRNLLCCQWSPRWLQIGNSWLFFLLSHWAVILSIFRIATLLRLWSLLKLTWIKLALVNHWHSVFLHCLLFSLQVFHLMLINWLDNSFELSRRLLFNPNPPLFSYFIKGLKVNKNLLLIDYLHDLLLLHLLDPLLLLLYNQFL